MNDHGVLCIGEAGVAFDEFLQAYAIYRTPEELHERYPELSEAEIRSALSYSLHNPDDVSRNLPELGAYWKSHSL